MAFPMGMSKKWRTTKVLMYRCSFMDLLLIDMHHSAEISVNITYAKKIEIMANARRNKLQNFVGHL
jgi:hypothetical protein